MKKTLDIFITLICNLFLFEINLTQIIYNYVCFKLKFCVKFEKRFIIVPAVPRFFFFVGHDVACATLYNRRNIAKQMNVDLKMEKEMFSLFLRFYIKAKLF